MLLHSCLVVSIVVKVIRIWFLLTRKIVHASCERINFVQHKHIYPHTNKNRLIAFLQCKVLIPLFSTGPATMLRGASKHLLENQLNKSQ